MPKLLKKRKEKRTSLTIATNNYINKKEKIKSVIFPGSESLSPSRGQLRVVQQVVKMKPNKYEQVVA